VEDRIKQYGDLNANRKSRTMEADMKRRNKGDGASTKETIVVSSNQKP